MGDSARGVTRRTDKQPERCLERYRERGVGYTHWKESPSDNDPLPSAEIYPRFRAFSMFRAAAPDCGPVVVLDERGRTQLGRGG